MTQVSLGYDPMTVIGLHVDSFQRLKVAQVQPSPTGLVPVRGKNEQGKSSLIESMMNAFLGKKAKSGMPITKGQDTAKVVVQLGQISVTRSWSKGPDGKAKSKLTLTAANGSEIKSPQAILDHLVGEFADPGAFLRQSAAEQVKTFLRIMKMDGELAHLEGIAEGHFNRRRDLGRDRDKLQKSVDTLAEEVQGLPAPPTDGTLPELTEKLTQAKDHNAARDTAKKNLENLASNGKGLAFEISELEAKLEKKKAEKEQVGKDWMAQDKALKAMDPVIDIEPIAKSIEEHQAAAEHEGRRQLFASKEAELNQAIREHNAAASGLEEARHNIQELIQKVEFPDPTMAYDAKEKTITVGDIPFAQASQAQKLKVAAAIAMAGEPTVRVMFIRDASLLDEDSQKLLGDMAAERGFQLWCEIVDSTPEGVGIYIEDGEVVETKIQ